MNKRFLMAGVAAAAVFSVVFGLAASLTVTSGTLGAGGSTVSSCDTDGVNTANTVEWDNDDERFEVTEVTVSGIAMPACDGGTVYVQLTGSGGSAIAGASGSAMVSGASVSVILATPPAASDVMGVQVAIVK